MSQSRRLTLTKTIEDVIIITKRLALRLNNRLYMWYKLKITAFITIICLLVFSACVEKKTENTVSLEKEPDNTVVTEEDFFSRNYITRIITPYLSQPEVVMNLKMKIPKISLLFAL